MRKLILKNFLSLGDIVMLTAAVRDLHRAHPQRFLTDVRTSCGALWEHNPYLTRMADSDPDAEVIECHYPLIHRSNQAPVHCVSGFTEFLSEKLGIQIPTASFGGDIHLSAQETTWMSQVQEMTRRAIPFWIIVAGGKFDFTIKWWDHRRYQQVVDHFRNRIQFVQVGQAGHYHPRLRGVIDLRGRTDLRQLVRLVYHAQGVLCGVTGLMHLAAAVPAKPGQPPRRPCVVVAGGREPPQWEAYPHHQFIHNVGALPCCAHGGCWRARTVPLNDGLEHDAPHRICTSLKGALPRCMDLIPAEEVIRRIEGYYSGGVLRYLTREDVEAGRLAMKLSRRSNHFDQHVNWFTARDRLDEAVRLLRQSVPAPRRRGQGIILCGRGETEFPRVTGWLAKLRQTGCRLPVEVWWMVPGDTQPGNELQELGASLVEVDPAHRANLKAHSLLGSGLQEIWLADVGVLPANPARLFRAPAFRRFGACFRATGKRVELPPPLQKLSGLDCESWREMDTGSLLLDMARCDRVVRLWQWLSQHPHFFTGGDAVTLQFAFRVLQQPHSIAARPALRP